MDIIPLADREIRPYFGFLLKWQAPAASNKMKWHRTLRVKMPGSAAATEY